MQRKHLIIRNANKNVGWFYSKKMKKQIRYESILERNFMYLLEFNPDVISYKEQPFTKYYMYDKKNYRYTPDIQVNFKDQNSIVYEVKPSNKLKEILEEPRHSYKFEAIRTELEKNNCEFRYFTENDYSQTSIKNIEFLYYYSDLPINIEIESRIAQLIKNSLSISAAYKDLVSDYDAKDVLVSIYQLIYHKSIEFDLDTYKLPLREEDIIYELI